MNWYLIQTKPHGCKDAHKNLKRQGFEVFLPMIIKTDRKRGQFVSNHKPLFPGYLFMGTTLRQVPWTSINGTRGVARAVQLDGKYRKINEEIIEGIKSRCDVSGIVQQATNFVSGDNVKIEKGPFTDFICTVENVTDSLRVWVLIEIMQQKIRTSVAQCDLSTIN